MTEQDTAAEDEQAAIQLAHCRYQLASALQLRLIDHFNNQRIAMSPQFIAQEAVHHADCLLEALGMADSQPAAEDPSAVRVVGLGSDV